MNEVVTFGETMGAFRGAGRIDRGTAMFPQVVGAESNQAIGLARLGHRVHWVSRVGDDVFGELIHRQLRGEQVVVSAAVDPQRPTGLMFVEQRSADQLSVIYRRSGSAVGELTLAEIDAELSQRPRLFSVTGITPALSSKLAQTWRAAIERAHQLGVPVILDVNYRSRLWSAAEAAAAIRPVLPLVTILVASADELPIVQSGPESEAVAALLAQGVTEVVVKRGELGASVYTESGECNHPAFPVTAVDVIGAGDAFVAGYLSGWLDGLAVADRLRRGTQLGAWAVGTVGDWEGLPTRDELAATNFADVIR